YLALAYSNLGNCLEDHQSSPGEIIRNFERGAAIVGELVDANPEDTDQMRQLGSAFGDLGWRYFEIGDPKKGRQCVDRSLQILKAILDKDPIDARTMNVLANTYHVLAHYESEVEDRDAAFKSYSKAIDFHKQLIAAHPSVTTYQQGLARDLN